MQKNHFEGVFNEARTLLKHGGKSGLVQLQYIGLDELLRLQINVPPMDGPNGKRFNQELLSVMDLIQKNDFELGLAMKDGKVSIGYRFGTKNDTPWQRVLALSFLGAIINNAVSNPFSEDLTADKTAPEFRRAQEYFMRMVGRTVAKIPELVDVSSQRKI